LGKSEDGAKTEDEVVLPPPTEAAARSPAVATTATTAATVTALLMPTYESVQASQHYSVAKTLLNNGDFEDALQTIEEGLELTRAILLSEGGLPEEALAVHPALGVRCAMLDSLCVCVCVCVCGREGACVLWIAQQWCRQGNGSAKSYLCLLSSWNSLPTHTSAYLVLVRRSPFTTCTVPRYVRHVPYARY
jgi:hypothetical protein